MVRKTELINNAMNYSLKKKRKSIKQVREIFTFVEFCNIKSTKHIKPPKNDNVEKSL